MIVYKDPITNKIVQGSNPNAVPEGVSYTEVPSYKDEGLRDALVDFDANGLPVYDLVKAQAIKIKEANRKCTEALSIVTNGYSEAEMKTWDTQEKESRQYVADVAAGVTPEPTPFLDGLSAGTGILVADLADKIILKADAYKGVAALNVGKRQVMVTLSKASLDITELKAITY